MNRGDRVQLRNSLSRGDTHLALTAGNQGTVLAVFDEFKRVAVKFDVSGLQVVPDAYLIPYVEPFTPGMYRSTRADGALGSGSLGYKVCYFTYAPDPLQWVRI